MKKIIFLLVFSVLLTGCGQNHSFEIGYSSNLVNNKDKVELKKILEENNISNIDKFFSLVDNFNKEKDMGCGIKDWDKTNKFKYDEIACANRYEKNHDISDGNCRLTAFSLIENKINIKDKSDNYGSYLMFDIDVLENNQDYDYLNNSFGSFISLYDEMNIQKLDYKDLDKVFTQKWHDKGITMEDGNASLISVVMHDPLSEVLFVGHTGILFNLQDKYLFIEKIAFEQPYQISVVKEKEDLKDIFKERPSYFGESDELGPFVYENDKLLFSY